MQIKGSDLQATQDINITTGELTIEASRNSQQSQSNTQHVDATIAQTVYGAAGGPTVNANISRGEGQESSSTVNNSTLTAQNINLSSEGDTTIDGANIGATEKLNLNVGGNLIVASQQNTYSSNSHNAGISGGFGLGADASAEQNGKTISTVTDNIGQSNGEVSSISAGLNAGSGRTTVRQTELTTLTGNSVDINVTNKTTIAGAAIAAVDENGVDNGQLNLETQSLEVVHLNDSSYSNQLNQAINTGVGVGSTKANSDDPNVNVNTSTLQYSNSSNITEGKTLATIGQGTITVRDDQEAGTDSTTDLNRDMDNTTLELYDVDRQQGNVDLTVDTRLLTEDGRDQIAEDLLKSGMIANAIKLAATTDRVGVEDLIDEVQKSNNTYEAVKAEIKKDPALAEALQNPDLTAEQKEAMLNGITDAVLIKLGYATHNNLIISTAEPGQDGEQVKGFYSSEDADAYINDLYNNSTEELVTTAGHEASHAMDMQDGIDINNPDTKADNEAYATNYGENVADYTDMALDINGYDDGMAQSNSHTGNATSATVQQSNADFAGLDKNQGDNYLKANEMEQAAQEMAGCLTSQCRQDTYDKYKKISVENLEFLISNCNQGGATSPACMSEIQAQYNAVLNYQLGEYDLYAENSKFIKAALLQLNKTNVEEKDTAGQKAAEYEFKVIAESLGIREDYAQSLAVMASAGALTFNPRAGGGGITTKATSSGQNVGSGSTENITTSKAETPLTQGEINQKAINDQGWDNNTGQTVSAGNQKVIDATPVNISTSNSKVISQYDPLNEGPLPSKIASTFRSNTYMEVVTTEPVTLYRVYGGSAIQLGGYWTRTPPSGPVQSIVDSALNPQWGNTATNVVKIEVPAGTKFYEGVAAPQGGLVGGGDQVLFPKDIKIDSSWIQE